MPPMIPGSTRRVASTLRPAASSIRFTSCAASSRRARRPSSLELEDSGLLRDQPLELGVHLVDLGDPPFSAAAGDVADELVASASSSRALRFTCGSIWGYGGTSGARPTTRPLRRSSQDLAHLGEAALLAGGLEQGLGVDTVGDGHAPLVLRRESLDVGLFDRLLDQPALVVLVEDLARDLLGGEERQLDDVAADLLAQPGVLGGELLAVLLQLLLEVGVRALLRLLDESLGLAASVVEDLLAVGLRFLALLRGQLAELARFGAGLVGLVEGLADAVAPLVDQPLIGPKA